MQSFNDIGMKLGHHFSVQHQKMTYYLLIPAYPVNLIVDHFIVMRGSGCAGYERMFPNNKAEIFFNFGDTIQSCGGLDAPVLRSNIVSGIKSGFFDFIPPAHLHMAGMRFTLFGFQQLFRIPAYRLTGQSFPLCDVLGKEMSLLQEQLLGAPDNNTVFSLLTSWVLSCMSKISYPDLKMWSRLEKKINEPNMQIAALLDYEMGYSRKHSIQLFKTHAGLSPKDVQRISRFNKTLQKIAQAPVKSWAQFACDAGYADQSHFIREFKSFSGYTPIQYLQLKPHEYLYYENLPEDL